MLLAAGCANSSTDGTEDGVASLESESNPPSASDVDNEQEADGTIGEGARGGDGDSGGRSGSGGGSASDPANPDGADAEAAFLACMSDQGVDLPSSEGSEGSQGNAVDGGTVDGPDTVAPQESELDQEAFEAALEQCGGLAEELDPTAGMNAEQSAALDDFLLEMEKCLADRGFNIPLTENGNSEEADAAFDEFLNLTDEEYAEFQIAGEECEKQVPTPAELEGFGLADDQTGS